MEHSNYFFDQRAMLQDVFLMTLIWGVITFDIFAKELHFSQYTRSDDMS